MTCKYWDQCPKRSTNNPQCRTGVTDLSICQRAIPQKVITHNTGKPKRPNKAKIIFLPILAPLFFVGWIMAHAGEKAEYRKTAEKAKKQPKKAETHKPIQ